MQTVNKFLDGVEKLLRSNVINAGREIRSFLITLTEDEGSKEVIRSCSIGYHLNEDYRRVVIEGGTLPVSDERKVAFVTSLLFAIDTKKIETSSLLKSLYPTLDVTEGYAQFLENFVKPYAESFVNLTIGEPIVEDTAPNTPVLDKMNDDVTAGVNELLSRMENSHYPEEAKSAVKFFSNGLVYTLSYKDALLTKITYFGLINTMRRYNVKLTEQEEYLTSVLRLYGVL